jgi:hypothetical protein
MPPPSIDAGDEAIAAQMRELIATVAAMAEGREATDAQQAARDHEELLLALLPLERERRRAVSCPSRLLCVWCSAS